MNRLLVLFLMMAQLAWAQEDDSMKKKAYHTLINSLIKHSVPEIRAKDVGASSEVIWLDAREEAEYKVSRIGQARFVGYDVFEISKVEYLDKDAKIVVYCSIGYRSEKIAEQLVEEGFTNVHNLYGGIFEWHNEGQPVLDSLGLETNKVHGYGRTWGIWLNDAEVVY